MATKVFNGDTDAVQEVQSATVTGTWATGDTGTLTCGGKSVTFTVAATETIAAVVAGLEALWNDSEEGALEEVTAADASPDITMTGDEEGVPFTITTSEVTAGDGAIGNFSVDTDNAGPADWSVATNWDTGAVPANTDNVKIEATEQDIKWGLGQSAVTLATLDIRKSFTGDLGLPRINDCAHDFVEYRETYLEIGATVCNIGEGEGDGSGRIKIDFGSVQTACAIYGSGSRAERGVPAILLKGTHASNTLKVLRGDVGVAFFAGETATLATLEVGHMGNVLGDATVVCGSGVSLTTVTQSGGQIDIDTTAQAIATFTVQAGEATIRGDTNGITTLTVNKDGTVYDLGGSGTITNLYLTGEYDHSRSMVPRTITNLYRYPGSVFRDPYGVVTVTNGHDYVRCAPQDCVNVTAPNKTWTESAI